MGARIGSVTLLVLLIGVAQYCQAASDRGLTKEAATTKAATNSIDNATGNAINEKSSSNTVASKGESEDFETDDALDESGNVKFENLRVGVQEGVLAGPAPAPSSAFSILPSFVTPAVALSLSLVVLAAKAL